MNYFFGDPYAPEIHGSLSIAVLLSERVRLFLNEVLAYCDKGYLKESDMRRSKIDVLRCSTSILGGLSLNLLHCVICLA